MQRYVSIFILVSFFLTALLNQTKIFFGAIFWDELFYFVRQDLTIPGCPRNHYVDLGCFKLTETLLRLPPVQNGELKANVTIVSFGHLK